jgi:UDP-3-O-[3-hydroxymyristoyl] N-acetylglucosamine deacetylase
MAAALRLARTVTLSGVGLHSGDACAVHVRSGAPGSGVVFRTASGDVVRATVDAVASTDFATTLVAPDGGSVATVEHLLAAVSACRLDDLRVDVDGPEIPILDGSSREFIEAFERCGLMPACKDAQKSRHSCRRYIDVKRPVHVATADETREAWLLPKPPHAVFTAALAPGSSAADQLALAWQHCDTVFGLTLSADVDFSDRGLQRCTVETSVDRFVEDVAAARTFTFQQDIAQLWDAGLAKGGSLDCAVFFDDAGEPLNPGGLRFPDEWARHKLLDCIGDLALAGHPLHAHYHGVRPGHALNVALVKELLSSEENYAFAEVSSSHL